MDGVRFFVPGRPLPLARARHFWDDKTGLGVRNKPNVRAYQDKVGWHAKVAGCRRIEGPVELRLEVYVSGRRGDLSNYVKMIEDGLNGVAWMDDRQVIELAARFIEKHHVEEVGEGVDVEVIER